jgi:hypothetical protein
VKVCLEPDCPALTTSSRCERHTRARDRARGTRQERGYDAAHVRARAQWQKFMDDGGEARCWRCGVVLDPKLWHLGHDDHDRSVYCGPECVPCNTATAGRRRGWGDTP